MAGNKVTITFKDKEIECTEVQPGVVQKTPSIFYIQDCVSKEWLYCFPERLERLNDKYNGDLSEYKGRETRAQEREVELAAKEERKAARAAAKAAKEAEEAGGGADAEEAEANEEPAMA
jgi:hypothetical protein